MADDRSTTHDTTDGTSARPRLGVMITILAHPDFRRAGEVSFPLGCDRLVRARIDRLHPRFGPPTGGNYRPLETDRVSRKALAFNVADDGVQFDSSDGDPENVRVDGCSVAPTLSLPASALDRGIVISLRSGKPIRMARVVLLMHRTPLTERMTLGHESEKAIIGESEAMYQVRKQIKATADDSEHVLVLGETGTGKEAVAAAIAELKSQPLVKTNAAAVTPSIAGLELFGARKGAGEGIDKDRDGLFQAADHGCLLFDEIGDIPFSVQAALLRVAQFGEVSRTGAGGKPSKVDVRIIGATNRPIDNDRALFRADLFQRLSGHIIRLPPLRQRREDLGRLILMFLTRELAKRGKLVLLSPNAGQAWFNGELVLQLASYDWPGNVRQLGLTIGRIVACSSSLPRAQLDPETERVLDASRTEAARLDPTHALPRESGTTKLTDEAIVDSHERLGGYVGKTAESLGIRKERVRQALQRQGKPTSTTLSYLEANRLLKVHGTEREAARSLGMDVRAFSVALRKLDRSDDKEA